MTRPALFLAAWWWVTEGVLDRGKAAITVAKADGRWPELATVLQAESIPLVVARMTTDQAGRVLELIASGEVAG